MVTWFKRPLATSYKGLIIEKPFHCPQKLLCMGRTYMEDFSEMKTYRWLKLIDLWSLKCTEDNHTSGMPSQSRLDFFHCRGPPCTMYLADQLIFLFPHHETWKSAEGKAQWWIGYLIIPSPFVNFWFSNTKGDPMIISGSDTSTNNCMLESFLD